MVELRRRTSAAPPLCGSSSTALDSKKPASRPRATYRIDKTPLVGRRALQWVAGVDEGTAPGKTLILCPPPTDRLLSEI